MKLTTLILFLFVSINTFGQNKECEKFRNGHFKILKDSTANETYIIRYDSIQTVEIIETKERSYIQKSTANFSDFIKVSEVYILIDTNEDILND